MPLVIRTTLEGPGALDATVFLVACNKSHILVIFRTSRFITIRRIYCSIHIRLELQDYKSHSPNNLQKQKQEIPVPLLWMCLGDCYSTQIQIAGDHDSMRMPWIFAWLKLCPFLFQVFTWPLQWKCKLCVGTLHATQYSWHIENILIKVTVSSRSALMKEALLCFL